jgi:hypothetical protein
MNTNGSNQSTNNKQLDLSEIDIVKLREYM